MLTAVNDHWCTLVLPAVNDDWACVRRVEGMNPPKKCQQRTSLLRNSVIRPNGEVKLPDMTLAFFSILKTKQKVLCTQTLQHRVNTSTADNVITLLYCRNESICKLKINHLCTVAFQTFRWKATILLRFTNWLENVYFLRWFKVRNSFENPRWRLGLFCLWFLNPAMTGSACGSIKS